jgi:hypothetical protein
MMIAARIADTNENLIEEDFRAIKIVRFGQVDTQTSFLVSSFGDESLVPVGYKALHMPTGERGNSVIIGYLNPVVLDGLNVGEKRVFSTNEAGDTLSIDIIMRNDGTMEVGGDTDFMVRYSELETAYNQLKDDHDALVQAFNDFKGEVQDFASQYIPGGPAIQGLPAAFVTVTPDAQDSTGDISGAKIDEIKTI